MTKYVGKFGQVEVPGGVLVAGMKSWTLDVTVDVIESTSFDESAIRSYISTVRGWSGSFEGYKTGIALVMEGGETSIYLKETNTADQKWLGGIIITGLTASSSHDGLVTYAYTFQGTGDLTVAVA